MNENSIDASIHPSRDVLEKFANGRLDEGTSTSIEEHLESCDSCCQSLATISTQKDRFVTAVVSAAVPGPECKISGWHTNSEPAKIPGAIGRFEIREQIGRGGFGNVMLAHDQHLDRDVALKLPRDGVFLTTTIRQRFLREARAAAALNHPHIVPVYEAGEEQGWCYLATALCRGPNLADWFANQRKPINVETAVKVVLDIAEAVHHAHERGVLHRDIKPANILLDPIETPRDNRNRFAYVPMISDFGLAKFATSEAEATHSNIVMGTVNYMAPEQARGRNGEVGHFADVYGLGAVLYELLTGRPPIVGETDLETLQQIQNLDPVPPRTLVPKIPIDVETICLKSLEKKPQRRYYSAAKLADDLRSYLDGKPIKARPVSATARFGRWIQRNPLIAAFSAGLLGAVFLIVAGAIAHVSQLESEVQLRIEAERRANQNLANSLILSARMGRQSGQMGQRFSGLNSIHKAVDLINDGSLNLDKRVLRSEAIGVLSLADARRLSTWKTNCLQSGINVLDFDRNLNFAAFCDQENQLVLFDLVKEDIVWTVPLKSRPFRVLLMPDASKIVCLSHSNGDNGIHAFDLSVPSGNPTDLSVVGSPVDGCISSDGQQLAVASDSSCVTRFSTENLTVLGTTQIPGGIAGCRFTPDLIGLITWSANRVGIYDFDGTEVRQFIAPHHPQLQLAAMSPDCKFVVAGGSSHEVYCWHPALASSPFILDRHQGWITNILFSIDSRTFFTSSSDGITRIWDAMALREKVAFPGQAVRLNDSETRMAGLVGNDVVRWGIETGRERMVDPVYREAYEADLDRSGDLLATVSTNGIFVWSIPDWKYEAHIECENGLFIHFFDGPDGCELLYSCEKGVFRARVIRQSTGQVALGDSTRVSDYDCDCAHSVSFSAGTKFAMCADEGKVIIDDVTNLGHSYVIDHPDLSGASISPDGTRCVTFTQHAKGVSVWDIKSKTSQRCAEEYNVCGAVFDPTERFLIVDSYEAILLLNAQSLSIVKSIPWKTSAEAVRRISDWAFANEGKLMAIRRVPYVINLVDLNTATILTDIPVKYPYPWVEVTPNGDLLICTDENMRTQILDLSAIRKVLGTLGLDWNLDE